MEEIRRGYSYSLGAAIVVSFGIAIVSAGIATVEGGITSMLPGFFTSLTLFSIFSLMFTAIFGCVVGIPTYWALSKLNVQNPIIIVVIGGATAYVLAVINNENNTFRLLYLIYGIAASMGFWLGSKRVQKKL